MEFICEHSTGQFGGAAVAGQQGPAIGRGRTKIIMLPGPRKA
nr:MAG TPA: hypothetical protein [Caudoviricetes sp.]DAW39159.1 MAG TPA: hypothetical protein [Caudoviricetes sp.]